MKKRRMKYTKISRRAHEKYFFCRREKIFRLEVSEKRTLGSTQNRFLCSRDRCCWIFAESNMSSCFMTTISYYSFELQLFPLKIVEGIKRFVEISCEMFPRKSIKIERKAANIFVCYLHLLLLLVPFMSHSRIIPTPSLHRC